jgi:CubicO group peptidase (beta-lactamase class C family)
VPVTDNLDHSDLMPSAFGGDFDLQDFYRGFTLEEITPENMQRWPYYRVVSARWSQYVQTATVPLRPARVPRPLVLGERFDLNDEFEDGKSYLQSLVDCQVKGFVVIRDGLILAEFYDNGFNLGDANLLQSASKTYAGVITHQLIDAGKLDPTRTVAGALPDFADTTIGEATVQQVLDMMSGARTLLDFKTPGTPDQRWEVEVGLQAGEARGHVAAIKAAGKASEPGTVWNYSDKNTDTLALLAERVTGGPYVDLLQGLFDAFGSNDGGSLTVSADGTACPCYGISASTRDFALFHQWIARGAAPASYYDSATDRAKSEIRTTNPLAAVTFPGTNYGSQTYFMIAENVLHSSGSYGQIGMSDMDTGTAIAMHADWANNAEPAKFEESRARGVAIISALR